MTIRLPRIVGVVTETRDPQTQTLPGPQKYAEEWPFVGVGCWALILPTFGGSRGASLTLTRVTAGPDVLSGCCHYRLVQGLGFRGNLYSCLLLHGAESGLLLADFLLVMFADLAWTCQSKPSRHRCGPRHFHYGSQDFRASHTCRSEQCFESTQYSGPKKHISISIL